MDPEFLHLRMQRRGLETQHICGSPAPADAPSARIKRAEDRTALSFGEWDNTAGNTGTLSTLNDRFRFK